MLYNDREQGDAPPDELSYEDALLDAQLRLLMRADFDGVEPSPGQYAQVERLISQENGADQADRSLPALPSLPSSRPFLPPLTSDLPVSPFRASKPSGRFYRLLTGAVATRLLPGGIALAMMMMVLGANVSQLLEIDSFVRPTPVVGEGSSQPTRVPPDSPVIEPPVSNPEIFSPHDREVLPPLRQEASAPSSIDPDTTPMPDLELRSE